MQYNPGTIGAGDVTIVTAPESHLEKQMYISASLPQLIGRVTTDAAGTHAWIDNAVTLGSSNELQCLVTKTGGLITTLDNCSITFTLATGTATAKFNWPSFAEQRRQGITSVGLPEGWATDINGAADAAAPTTDITGITSAANMPANAEFEVWSFPKAAEWMEVSCVTDATGPLPTSSSFPVACGYNPQAFSKRARPEPRELRITEKYKGAMQGVLAYNGRSVCIRVDVKANGIVLKERWLYTGYFVSGGPERQGDDNDVVLQTSTGSFDRGMMFIAR